ncbi:hypothetical protein IE077_000644, partial [Cardiosporidium cionae]
VIHSMGGACLGVLDRQCNFIVIHLKLKGDSLDGMYIYYEDLNASSIVCHTFASTLDPIRESIPPKDEIHHSTTEHQENAQVDGKISTFSLPPVVSEEEGKYGNDSKKPSSSFALTETDSSTTSTYLSPGGESAASTKNTTLSFHQSMAGSISTNAAGYKTPLQENNIITLFSSLRRAPVIYILGLKELHVVKLHSWAKILQDLVDQHLWENAFRLLACLNRGYGLPVLDLPCDSPLRTKQLQRVGMTVMELCLHHNTEKLHGKKMVKLVTSASVYIMVIECAVYLQLWSYLFETIFNRMQSEGKEELYLDSIDHYLLSNMLPMDIGSEVVCALFGRYNKRIDSLWATIEASSSIKPLKKVAKAELSLQFPVYSREEKQALAQYLAHYKESILYDELVFKILTLDPVTTTLTMKTHFLLYRKLLLNLLRFLFRMDLMKLNLDQILRIFSRHSLWTGVAYVYIAAMSDFLSPLHALLNASLCYRKILFNKWNLMLSSLCYEEDAPAGVESNGSISDPIRSQNSFMNFSSASMRLSDDLRLPFSSLYRLIQQLPVFLPSCQLENLLSVRELFFYLHCCFSGSAYPLLSQPTSFISTIRPKHSLPIMPHNHLSKMLRFIFIQDLSDFIDTSSISIFDRLMSISPWLFFESLTSLFDSEFSRTALCGSAWGSNLSDWLEEALSLYPAEVSLSYTVSIALHPEGEPQPVRILDSLFLAAMEAAGQNCREYPLSLNACEGLSTDALLRILKLIEHATESFVYTLYRQLSQYISALSILQQTLSTQGQPPPSHSPGVVAEELSHLNSLLQPPSMACVNTLDRRNEAHSTLSAFGNIPPETMIALFNGIRSFCGCMLEAIHIVDSRLMQLFLHVAVDRGLLLTALQESKLMHFYFFGKLHTTDIFLPEWKEMDSPNVPSGTSAHLFKRFLERELPTQTHAKQWMDPAYRELQLLNYISYSIGLLKEKEGDAFINAIIAYHEEDSREDAAGILSASMEEGEASMRAQVSQVWAKYQNWLQQASACNFVRLEAYLLEFFQDYEALFHRYLTDSLLKAQVFTFMLEHLDLGNVEYENDIPPNLAPAEQTPCPLIDFSKLITEADTPKTALPSQTTMTPPSLAPSAHPMPTPLNKRTFLKEILRRLPTFIELDCMKAVLLICQIFSNPTLSNDAPSIITTVVDAIPRPSAPIDGLEEAKAISTVDNRKGNDEMESGEDLSKQGIFQGMITPADILDLLNPYPALQLKFLSVLVRKNVASCFSNRYLELLCQLRPKSVISYLMKEEGLQLKCCLAICSRYNVTAASLYLMERTQDLEGAIALLQNEFSKRLETLRDVFLHPNTDIMKHTRRLLPDTSSNISSRVSTNSSLGKAESWSVCSQSAPRWTLHTVMPRATSTEELKMQQRGTKHLWDSFKEANDCVEIVNSAADICQRNTHILGETRMESLWFGFLQEVVILQQSLSKLQAQRSLLRLKAFTAVLSELVSNILCQGMILLQSLPVALKRIVSIHSLNQLAIFKNPIVQILGGLAFEEALISLCALLASRNMHRSFSLLEKKQRHSVVSVDSSFYDSPSGQKRQCVLCSVCHAPADIVPNIYRSEVPSSLKSEIAIPTSLHQLNSSGEMIAATNYRHYFSAANTIPSTSPLSAVLQGNPSYPLPDGGHIVIAFPCGHIYHGICLFPHTVCKFCGNIEISSNGKAA